jgi:RHS repeat-associated protein
VAVSGQLDPGNETAMYGFTASQGQRVYVDMQSLSGGTTSSRWRLIDPLGQQVFNQVLGTDVETGELVMSGRYTLLLEGRITETNSRNYTLNVELLTEAVQPLALGQTVQGTIRVTGEQDVYGFNLAERTLLYFDSLTPSNTLTWTLEGPAGVVVSARLFSLTDTGSPLFTLDLVPGDYRLTVDAIGDARLPYAFRLQPFAGLSPGADPRLLSGFLATGQQVDVFEINGVAGEKLYLDFDSQGGSLFGPASLFVGTSRLLVTTAGGTEDGYAGIAAALRQLPFRSSAALNVILVTDENRDVVDSTLTLAGVIAEARTNNVRMNVVLDGLLQDSAGHAAIGLDASLRAYVADGSGGFVVSTNGSFIGPAVNDDAPENPLAEYVPLAWQTGGATWDLNQLRLGGTTAVSFTKAFVEVNAESIELQLLLNLMASDPSVVFTNLTGILDGIGSGDTATFSFRLTRTGDARSFALQFVRPGTTDVLASIPVRFRNEYVYQIQGFDPDGDRLRFTLVQGPQGATVDPNTGALRWRPQTNETSQFVVRVEDGRGGLSFQEFSVSVAGTNRPPQIGPVPYPLAAIDRVYTFPLDAFDPDGDRLSFELLQSPAGMSIDGSAGIIRWRPAAAQLGRHTAIARVKDGRGGVAERNWEVEVVSTVSNANPAFVSSPLTVARAGRQYFYRARAADPNADELTFDLPLGPSGLSVSSNGLVLWAPGLSQIGSHDVIVRVRDNFGGVALQSFAIQVTAENTPPIVTSSPMETGVVGVPYRYEVQAQDAENQLLTFGFSNAPPAGVALVSHPFLTNAAVVDWTPTSGQTGVHRIALRVRDSEGAEAFQDFALTVTSTGANSPPRFLTQPRTETRVGLPYVYQAEATDVDADPLSFALIRGPAGMILTNSTTGTLRTRLLYWAPPALGAFPVTLTVSDGRAGGVVTQEFVLNVVSTLHNEAPVIVSTPATQATVRERYVYNLIAVDPDGDAITWRLVAGPAGMSLDPALGTLRWTPGLEQLGTIEITVEAADVFQAAVRQSFTLTVELANRPPQITSSPPTVAQTGEPLLYAARGVDPDGDPLRWSLAAFPAGMTMDAANGLLRWTPSPGQVGNHAVTIAVNDGRGGSSTQAFGLFATDIRANRAPIVVSSPPRDATIARPYSYLFRATDADGDTLTVQAVSSLPPGAAFTASGPGAGVLSWMPGAAQAGRFEFVLLARDPAGANASQRFFVTVRSNAIPVIVSTPLTNAVPTLPYHYDVRALDADGDVLSYTLIEGPTGMGVDGLGRISWLPSLAQTGNNRVTVTVSDGFGGNATQSFLVTAAADRQPPTVRLDIAYNLADSSGNLYVRAGSEVALRIEAIDDVEVAARELIVGGTAIPLTADGSAVATFPQTGTIEAVARAVDSSGNIAVITNYVPVVDPNATSTVAIVIISPTNSAEITRLVPVVATVTSEVPLSSYRLEVAALDSDMPSDGLQVSDPRLIFQTVTNATLPPGTLVLTNAIFGRFDPSALLNGGYLLRLSVFDQNGQGRQEGVLVSVAGQLKFGEFHLEFTDLTIPVAGVPITVKRVYDSREAGRSGDFGYGWSLGVQTGRILEVGKRPFVGLGGEGATFTLRTRVYVTTPDGRRIGFTFTPEFAAASLIFGSFYRPAFTADPGVYEKLEPLEAPAAYQIRGDGSVVTGFGLVGYDPQGYRLITKDNVVYQYDQHLGLQQVTDANGNRVVYVRDGVFSVQGGVTNFSQSIRFVRDGQGRIGQIIDPAGQRLTYAYDGVGDLRGFTDQVTNLTQYVYSVARAHYLTNIVDPFGRLALRMEYDAAGRLSGVRDALGNPVRQDFNADTLTGTFTDANGNVTEVRFDERGNEMERSVTGIYTNRFVYDANNNLLRSENGRGFATNYTYDSRGNVTSITDGLSNRTTVVYNELNKPVAVINELGQPLLFQYDRNGGLTNVVNALGVGLSLRRDESGHVVALTDVNGHTFTFGYLGCSCGSPTMVQYPDQSIRQFQYDDFGRRILETDETGVTTRYTYDGLGRLATVRDALTNTARYEYEGPLLARYVDPLGRITQYGYDELNRTNRITDAAGGVTRFEYDANGNRTKVIDSVTNITTFVYDAGNRLIRQIDPFSRTNFFSYDAAGNRIESIDRNGRRRTFAYDAANRMTNEVWWEGLTAARSVVFGFNGAGVQTYASDPAGTHQHTYDALNRLERFVQTGVPGQSDFILRYTYDNSTNVLSVTDQDGVTVGSVFNNRSRLIRRTWQGPGLDPARADFASDGAGRRLRIERYADLAGNSPIGSTTQAYNRAGILTNITHRGAANQLLARYDFNYDAALQMLRSTIVGIANQVSDFAYDGTGQLTNVFNAVPPQENFRYDPNGTRSGAQSGGNYVVGRNNQVLSDGVHNYAYDAEGNMSSRSNIVSHVVTTYQFDHRNRLVAILERNPAGVVTQTVAFTYDTANRRLSKAVNGLVTRFLYDRESSWADLDTAGLVTARYLHTDRLDELLARQRAIDGRGWYLTDHLGTVRDIATAGGAVVAHLDYSSFGRVVSSSNPAAVDRFLFTGREFDGETGWYFYRARYYDAGLGRFTSEDPIGFSGHDFNLYRYVGNRPTTLTDPLGQASLFEYSVTVGQRVFQFAIHPGHHYWTILGYRIYCVHIQLLTYLIGVSGSGTRIQIPLPWCSGAPF